jgi:hypothetical protein
VTLPAAEGRRDHRRREQQVTLPVKEGSDVTALAPEFTLAHGATISPASGTVRDFTKPVTYTVTGADGSRRTWTVQALVMKSPVCRASTPTRTSSVSATPTTSTRPPTASRLVRHAVQAFSSKDLVHWTDHGRSSTSGRTCPGRQQRLGADDRGANGKYYFYFCAAATGDTRNIGVAVSDSPAGPFTDALGKPLIAAGLQRAR